MNTSNNTSTNTSNINLNATNETLTNTAVVTEKRLDLDNTDEVLDSRYGPPTDGGYGWVVVGASFFLLFIVLGTVYSYAVFLKQYLSVTYKGRADLTTLSFIGTLATSLTTLCTILTGRMADRLGYRTCILIGGTIFSLGLLLASFSTEVWQLFLTQGVMVGLGGSIAYPAAVSAPSQWFNKKRGLATGIAVAGSGIGGLVISPLTQVIIDTLGVEWALRILAILSFVILMSTAFLIRERTKPTTKKGPLVDFSWFKNAKFTSFFLGGLISSFGYLVPFYLMPDYAKLMNLTTAQGSLLVGILNGGSAVGRIVLGSAADRLGRINVVFICVLFTSISCFVIWSFSTTFPSLIVFNILYGFAAGGYISLSPVIIAEQFGLQGLASIIGLLSFGTGIPVLVGTPIASAILAATKNSDGSLNYIPVIMYAGASALIGSLFILNLRRLVSTQIFKRV